MICLYDGTNVTFGFVGEFRSMLQEREREN
jgi:hypothetical protein